TRNGLAIRFSEADARAMGRTARGVKGIKLGKGDEVVGMLVADPDGQLLTVCENGYGKRTPFGPNQESGDGSQESDEENGDESSDLEEAEDSATEEGEAADGEPRTPNPTS